MFAFKNLWELVEENPSALEIRNPLSDKGELEMYFDDFDEDTRTVIQVRLNSLTVEIATIRHRNAEGNWTHHAGTRRFELPNRRGLKDLREKLSQICLDLTRFPNGKLSRYGSGSVYAMGEHGTWTATPQRFERVRELRRKIYEGEIETW